MPEIPYTVRLAPKLLERIEKIARDRGIAPRKLIRAVLAEHFAGDGRAQPGGPIERIEPATQPRSDSLRSDPHPAHAPAPARSPGRLRGHRPDPPDRATGSRALHAAAPEKNDMNLSRTAIRYELSCGSAAMLLRLYLRIQLLWIFIWAASDLFFVWYWTGRISGPGAHRIFRALDSRLVLHPEGPALFPVAPLPRRSRARSGACTST